MNFYKNELFKRVEKYKNIQEYIKNNKENYLSEEIWQIEMKNIKEKIDKTYEEIRSYR